MRLAGGEAAEEERLRKGGDRLRDRDGVGEIPTSGEALRLREDRRGDRRCGLDAGETLREALLETLLDALRERDRGRRGETLRERTLAEEDLQRMIFSVRKSPYSESPALSEGRGEGWRAASTDERSKSLAPYNLNR